MSISFRASAIFAIVLTLVFLVQGAPAPTPYGFQFVRTDQDPFNVLYDDVHQRFFVSVPGTNTVYVVSEADGSVAAKINLPSPAAMDLSVDCSLLYVVSKQIVDGYFVLDSKTLRVVEFVTPVVSPINSQIADPSGNTVPSGIAALANGKVLYNAIPKGGGVVGTLFLYDPVTGVAAPRQPSAMQQGGLLSKSRDGSRVVILDGANGLLSLYDVVSDAYIGQRQITDTSYWDAIVNADGSRVLLNGTRLYDQSLNQLTDLRPGGYISTYGGAAFSTDGSKIYTNSVYTDSLPKALTIYNSFGGPPIGYIPTLGQGTHPATGRLAVGKSGMALLLVDRGFAEVNVNDRTTQLTDIPYPSSFTVSPQVGLVNGLNNVAINILEFPYQPGTRVFFGDKESAKVTGGTGSTINAVPSPGSADPVSLSVLFPDHWAIYSPDGYSYGPVVLFQDVNAGSTKGGATVHIIGYGFNDPKYDEGVPNTYAKVTVGGAAAVVTEEIFGAIYSPYPFPIEHLTFTSPAGPDGPADIEITTPNGTTTVKNGFHYFTHQFVSGVLPTQMVLDEGRGKLYVSDSPSGDVKAIDTNTLAVTTLLPGGNSPATGLALSPDHRDLLVTSPSGVFTLFDLEVHAVVKRFTPGFGTAVTNFWDSVALTSRGTALIGLSTYGTNGFFEVDLGTGFATPVNGPAFYNAPLIAGSDDGTSVYLSDFVPTQGGVHFAVWRAANDAAVLTRSFYGTSSDLSTSANADRFLSDGNTYSPGLLQVGAVAVNDLYTFAPWRASGAKLHSSGALEYLPTINGVQIHDVASGIELLSIGFPGGAVATETPIVVDTSGRVIWVAESSGIGVLILDKAPLSIGSASPAKGNASGGSKITLTGSGFEPGALIAINGQSASAHVLSSTVLTFTMPAIAAKQVAITVTNPGGETYTLDAAYDASAKASQPKPIVSTLMLLPGYIPVPGGQLRFYLVGSGFTASTQIQMDELQVQTIYIDATQIEGVVYELPSPERWIVTAVNPAPGGGSSNPQWLTPAGSSSDPPSIDTVDNGASFISGSVVPGAIATIFGSHLTDAEGVNLPSGDSLPTELVNVWVLVNGAAAPIFAVDNVNGQQQINFQVPWELAGRSTATIQVVNHRLISATLNVSVAQLQPGIISYTMGGDNFGAIIHTNGQIADTAHPAAKGEIVLIYCTGLGAVTRAQFDGSPSPVADPTTTTARVAIGGIAATVDYSGLAPTFVGLYQINAHVPEKIASGNQPVVVTIGNATSNRVLLPIQ